MMLVTWVMYTLFKPYTIVQIYVRTSKSCKTVEISTITIDVKLQNLTKKCPWSQKVPLILIMSTFFKKDRGYFSENKILFLPFFAYAITIPITSLSYHHSLSHSLLSTLTFYLPPYTSILHPLPHLSLISTY